MLVTPQFSYLSVHFSLNTRISETRFVLAPWNGVEDLSVSLVGGVLVVVCLLSWLGRWIYQPCTSMVQVYQGVLRCQSVPLLAPHHVCFWGCRMELSCFSESCSVSVLTKDGSASNRVCSLATAPAGAAAGQQRSSVGSVQERVSCPCLQQPAFEDVPGLRVAQACWV